MTAAKPAIMQVLHTHGELIAGDDELGVARSRVAAGADRSAAREAAALGLAELAADLGQRAIPRVERGSALAMAEAMGRLMIALASSLTLFGCAEVVVPPSAPPLTQRQAAIQSHFSQTLADYHQSVVTADLLTEGSDPMAIRRSVRLLSDALIAIPHADAPVALAAQEIRVEEARASIASPDSAIETKAVHEALSAAQSALSDLAAGPYAAAPEASTLAAELGQAIGRIDTSASLTRERRLVIHALALADRTMTSMHSALARGVVTP